ncbi:MAG: molybdopterin-guanine dinucleotide biosynthesis protein B [Terrisporobacter sp.]|uniref:molybdopterin-guanine dinucleotide biosynthesis protein B n=1 Tax=Terrisporobacter sp. TaxID=1965305 RepID=UPI002FC907DC
MKNKPCLITICGCKNSGKTTLISKLIKRFCELGYKVATIKHDGHDFDSDIPGTDTYKHMESGAYGTAIFSKNKFMIVKEQKETDEKELISLFPEANLIILEGLKSSKYPKYEIIRESNSSISICNKVNLLAILSDMTEIDGVYKIIDLNNIDLIVEDILRYMKICEC